MVFDLKSSDLFLHSSDYNLRLICPNILKYEDRYIDYISEVFSFIPIDKPTPNYNKIYDLDLATSNFSSYLIFSILSNFLQNKIIIKKDIENYYTSEMLKFLKVKKHLSKFQLKSLALAWSSINKSIDLFLKKTKEHSSIKTNYKIYWSDSNFNYYEDVPLLGINEDDSLDIYLILKTSFSKYPLYSNDIDYLRIPSNVRILNYFITQDIRINSIRILWLDSSDMSEKIKYSEYTGIHKQKVYEYITESSDILNFKNNSIMNYNNLSQCYSCPYFVQCSSSNSLLDKDRLSYKKQNKKNYYETIL